MHRVLLLAGLAACNDGDGGATPVDSLLPVDTLAVDSPIDATSIDAPPGILEGQVLVGEDVGFGVGYAMFHTGPLYPVIGGTAGPCHGGGDVPDGSLDAGMVSMTGTIDPLDFQLSSSTDIYRPAGGSLIGPDVFGAGDVLTATATGATVPAFAGTVTAPEPIADIVIPTMYSRAAPPAITWTAGTGDTMWIWISPTMEVPGMFVCYVPDNGSFQLTPAMMALLPTSVQTIRIAVYRIHETMLAAGSWTIWLRAADIKHLSFALVTQ